MRQHKHDLALGTASAEKAIECGQGLAADQPIYRNILIVAFIAVERIQRSLEKASGGARHHIDSGIK